MISPPINKNPYLRITVSIVSFHFNFLQSSTSSRQISFFPQNSFNSLYPSLHEERGDVSIILFHRFAIYPQNRGGTIPIGPNSPPNRIDSRSVYNYEGILPRHQPSISAPSITAQTHTHAHTRTSIDLLSFARGEITASGGRSRGWRERSLLDGRMIRWSFDTWRGACISAVWSASPPRYALLALF